MAVKDVFIKRRVSRSLGGDIVLIAFHVAIACDMILPLIYANSQSLKPNNELWVFPPRFFAVTPTLDSNKNLFTLMSSSEIPFSRYIFNTVFITVVGTIGHIIIASLCAYPIASYRFPGSRSFFVLVQTSLMFSAAVTAIPSFIIVSRLKMLDTYWSLLLPAFASSLGLFLMKQFMEQSVPHAVLESAEMDGAGELRKFFTIVMPMVKPAWLTLMIFTVQGLWNTGASTYIYSEQIKTFPYALSQIAAAGVARAGVSAAISVLMMFVPLSVFIISQSNIIETMASSGMKE